ncbi:peptidyl-prolyl cis-trans isomerase [Fictibacillus aquaticus]|uniref:Peptidyl-prolyl cis-trans isomerase n=1 Tax=Fictibacillus aquaticus TaxID=2021314 RepID=A0A235FCC5_9BACL|nr:hypothetical protein [Fictibacillus aquaticus]OYD58988.1 hypothetical protein CGZ90_03545 [Fictibacillus aquaticus]
MEFILFLKGKVAHPLTIDPSVWIFDERKILVSEIKNNYVKEDPSIKYLKDVSSHWDREITKGAELPSEKEKESKITKKEYLLSSSFAMPFAPFIQNAEPEKDAESVVIYTADSSMTIPLEKAQECYLAFSKDGKPLKDDGPVHIYFPDSSMKPLLHVRGFELI